MRIIILLLSFTLTHSAYTQQHTTTNWILKTSVKNDALCLINTLMGESFYLKYYNKIFTEYEQQFTPSIRESLQRLCDFKNKNGLIVSAWLTKKYFDLPDSSLSFLNDAVKKGVGMKSSARIRKDLTKIIEFLMSADFEQKYKTTIEPVIVKRKDSLRVKLLRFNIVPEIEKTVGIPLQTDSVIFYLLKYTQPHGINLSSNAFISDISNNITVSVQVAIHEMLHPYFTDNNFGIRKQYGILLKDDFVHDAFTYHDQIFGYNDFESFINESIVRVLEQTISDKYGLVKDYVNHWKTEDKGMHVFAAILYAKMKNKGFPLTYKGTFKEFFVETVNDIEKEGGKKIYDSLYPSSN